MDLAGCEEAVSRLRYTRLCLKEHDDGTWVEVRSLLTKHAESIPRMGTRNSDE